MARGVQDDHKNRVSAIAAVHPVDGDVETACARFDAEDDVEELLGDPEAQADDDFDGPPLLLLDSVIGRRRWRREV